MEYLVVKETMKFKILLLAEMVYCHFTFYVPIVMMHAEIGQSIQKGLCYSAALLQIQYYHSHSTVLLDHVGVLYE